jgi:hypothetical protein
MDSEHGGPTPILVTAADRRSFDLLPGVGGTSKSASTTTVLVAFLMNVLVAVAKFVAAAVTASASMVAEAAHSWADSGNEILLMTANRRSRRPPDAKHPIGIGKEAYVCPLVAALGLLAAGAQSRLCVMCRNWWSRRPGVTSSWRMWCWLCRSYWNRSRSGVHSALVLAAGGLTASELTG